MNSKRALVGAGAVAVGDLPVPGAGRADRAAGRGVVAMSTGSGGSAATPMELWQMDTVGGFLLADGRRAKALTGVDDHSRFCVSAYLMLRETAQRVCDGLAAAMRTYGVPEEILTDNGKVFTGRFNRPPVEVLFDRVCRENGITHRLTQPRSPTTTGKVERFHRTLRAEFRTDRVFADLASAQAELDEWVADYNQPRPHSAIGMVPPVERFCRRARARSGQPEPSAGAGPHRGRLGGPACRRERRDLGVLAADLPGQGRRRPPRRRPRHRPGAAGLGRQPAAQDRAPHQPRGGAEEASLDPQDRGLTSNQKCQRTAEATHVKHHPEPNSPTTARFSRSSAVCLS